MRDDEYVLERCGTCTLVWQRFAPSDELVDEMYGKWSRDDEGLARQDTLSFHRSAAEEILLVLELAGRAPSTISVFDFGMGWGRWARMAGAFGCKSYGLDLPGPQVDYAESQGVEVVRFEDLDRLRFDFVNCEQVFEHLVDPYAALARLASSLAPDGWIKINVPEGAEIERRLQSPDWTAGRRTAGSLVAVAPLEHLNCYNRRSLETLAERVGLRPARPPLSAVYAATIGLWPPQRLARGLARPPLRRIAPRAVPNRARTTPGAFYFRPVER